MNGRPVHIRTRQAKKAVITPIVALHPSGPATHFLTDLHAYAAVGFPDDHGELLLATENLQPVIFLIPLASMLLRGRLVLHRECSPYDLALLLVRKRTRAET